MTFAEFVDAVGNVNDDERDCHIRSQSWYLTSETGRTVVPTDYLVTERLTEGLKKHTHYRVRHKTGVRNAAGGPQIQPTSRQSGYIRRIYAADQALYALVTEDSQG